jgi:hypothetical protein
MSARHRRRESSNGSLKGRKRPIVVVICFAVVAFCRHRPSSGLLYAARWQSAIRLS